MNLKYYLLFLVLYTTSLVGQIPRLDSLMAVVKTMPDDTSKVNTIYEIGRAYLTELSDLNKVGEYGKRGLDLSRKLNYKKGIAFAMINVGIFHRTNGNFDLAFYYDRSALKLMQELGNKKGESTCLLNIGLSYSEMGKYREALDYMKAGVKIKELIGDKRGVAIANNNMANIFQTQGDFAGALKHHLRALQMREEMQDKSGIASSFNNIGNIFYSQHKLDESLVYYLKAAKLQEELQNLRDLSNTYGNIGNVYREKLQFKEALTYLLKESKINEQIDNKQGIARSYYNIAVLYLQQNKSQAALAYHLRSCELFKQIEDKKGLAESLGGMGDVYEYMGDFSKAIHYYTEMLALTKELDFKEATKNTYNSLAKIYKKQKQFEKALIYTDLYNSLKDSLFNKENIKQVTELNTRYETEKKEKEILLLTKDQQLNAKIIKQQQLVRWGLLGGLGLLVVSIISIYRRYHFKQKANVILEKQKEEIHKKNILITDSIDYAKTIQEAVLPTAQEIKKVLPESFILYKPKAIVSGDFYWLITIRNRLICAVADCTGHGVPGAFMSLLGYNMLEEVAKIASEANPAGMLDTLNQQVLTQLSGDDKEETIKHGMDISLIAIDKTTDQLEYAGAHNSVYIIRQKELIELKADKTGIGTNKKNNKSFLNQSYHLKKGDMIYLFTDGFPDQLGGSQRKKFFYPPFKELLIELSALDMETQCTKLNETHVQWQGSMDQTDDILILGIRY